MKEEEIDAIFADIKERIHRKTVARLKDGVKFYAAITSVIKEEADSINNEFVKTKITDRRGFIIHDLGLKIIREHAGLVLQ
jgi:hypothetical protein